MASTARRVLAIGLGSLRGGSGNSNPSSPSAPSSLADGIDGMAAALKETPNGEDVANALVKQAGVVIEQQADKAEKASENADAALVKAAQKASANMGNPVVKSAAQLLAEAEAAGVAKAKAMFEARQQAAAIAAKNAKLKEAGAAAERREAEVMAETLAKLEADAVKQATEAAKAKIAEDAEKATERLSELKVNLEALVSYIKDADPNSNSNSNQNKMTSNITHTTLDETRKILKDQISKYEKEVAGLKTEESVAAKLSIYNTKLAKEKETIAKLQTSLNSSKNNSPNAISARRKIVSDLLFSNIVTIVFTTAINGANARKTELQQEARDADAKQAAAERAAATAAAGKAVKNAAAAASWGIGSVVGSFARTVAANPVRAATVGVASIALGAAVIGDFTGLYPGWTGLATKAFGLAAGNVLLASAVGIESTVIAATISTLSPLASSIFTGLFSKKPEEVKAAKMQLRSADAKVKKEVAAAEDKAAKKVSEATSDEGTSCGYCRAINTTNGKVCNGGKTPGKFIVDGHCVCTMHKNHPPDEYAKDKRGGTRRGSRSVKRQTRKYRF